MSRSVSVGDVDRQRPAGDGDFIRAAFLIHRVQFQGYLSLLVVKQNHAVTVDPMSCSGDGHFVAESIMMVAGTLDTRNLASLSRYAGTPASVLH